MSIIKDSFKQSKVIGSEPTKEELKNHHCYQGDILADGFVSPMVLPSDRLKDLQGTSTVTEMADICHLPTRELELLLTNDFLEPTYGQLLSISFAYGVSVLWLLGYHTLRDTPFSHADRDILAAIGKRNAAEATLYRVKEKVFLRDILTGIIKKRIDRLNRAVANTAAMLIATEHLPLSETELYLLSGQPVFIEFVDGNKEWGLVLADGAIMTVSGKLEIEATGTNYQAYQTPNTAITQMQEL